MTTAKLEEMIKDIEQHGGYSSEELALVKDAIHGFLDRRHGQYRYYEYFTIATGKKFGDALEALIIKSFKGFKKPENDTSYDALTVNGEKVEIKSLRACTKGQEHIFLLGDEVSPSRFSTSSYQQTKPSCCDWFIYHILYGDGSRLFLIPSKMISKRPGEEYAEVGKIPLSIQHRNHDTEGQVNLGQVIKYEKYFEIDNYRLESQYDFEDIKRMIVERMEAIRWMLPE